MAKVSYRHTAFLLTRKNWEAAVWLWFILWITCSCLMKQLESNESWKNEGAEASAYTMPLLSRKREQFWVVAALLFDFTFLYGITLVTLWMRTQEKFVYKVHIYNAIFFNLFNKTCNVSMGNACFIHAHNYCRFFLQYDLMLTGSCLVECVIRYLCTSNSTDVSCRNPLLPK